LGDLWGRPQLSRRDRSLIVITALMTQKSEEELEIHLRNAINHGLTREEINEVLITVAGYAGFPTAMPASRIFDKVIRAIDKIPENGRLPERSPAPPKSDAERWRDGAAVNRMIKGIPGVSDNPSADRETLGERIGDVGRLTFDFAFGEIWSRTAQMSKRDRSMVVITILTVLSKPDQLAVHVPGGLNHGLTKEEVIEIMVQMVIYCGAPRAVVGNTAARAAFKAWDEQQAKL